TVTIRNRNAGRISNGVNVPVVTSAPGIFTAVDNKNRTVAAIFHASNGSLVTQDNQAFRDEVLVMYATGLGAVNPTVAAGAPTPSAPLSRVTSTAAVCIGQHPYIMAFAGLAPGFVGLYQLNF